MDGEPVIAYRCWHADGKGRLFRFQPHSIPEPWPKPGHRCEAVCRSGRDAPCPPGAIYKGKYTSWECECGFYAYKEPDSAQEQAERIGRFRHGFPRAWIPVWGAVSIWGRLQEHEWGWRAQYAYPYALTVPIPLIGHGPDPGRVADAVRKAWRVDVDIHGGVGWTD